MAGELINGRSFISVDPVTNRMPQSVEATLPSAVKAGAAGGVARLNSDGNIVDGAGAVLSGPQVTLANLPGATTAGRDVLAAATAAAGRQALGVTDIAATYLTLANPAFDPAAPPTGITVGMVTGLLASTAGVAPLDGNKQIPAAAIKPDTATVLWSGTDWVYRNAIVTARPNAWRVDFAAPSNIPVPAWALTGDTRRITGTTVVTPPPAPTGYGTSGYGTSPYGG